MDTTKHLLNAQQQGIPNVNTMPSVMPPPVTPRLTDGGNTSVATENPGSGWAAFGSGQCSQLTIVNDTGTTIEWRQDEGSVALPVVDGESFTIFGINERAQIEVRRKDQSNTPVTVKARWEV